MGLRDYKETFQVSKKKLYAVICIWHKMSYYTKSPVNDGLLQVIHMLKEELPDYKEINVAYVYETSGLMDAKPFTPLYEDFQPYYKEPCEKADLHDLSHIFFMGMAMLRAENKGENADYRLYLITDEAIGRMNGVVWQTEEGLVMNPGFEDVHAQLCLLRPDGLNGDILETYIQNSKDGKVINI